MRIQSGSSPKKPLPRRIGGAILEGVRQIDEFVEKNPTLSTTLSTGVAASRAIHTFPKFVYPTVLGATPAERVQIYNGLDHLPLRDVNTVKSITMVNEIHSHKPGWVVNGRAFDHVATNRIELSRAQLVTPEKLQATLTHEVGHTVDYESQWFGTIGMESKGEPWGEGPHITDYATTNHKEDFAESYETYHLDPEALKEKNPDKYHRLEELSKKTPLERLMDREAFRETGKYIGNTFPNSGARHSAEVFHFAAGFLQAGHGLSLLSQDSQNDAGKHFRGVLNLAAGIGFASGMLAIPSMAVHSANIALQSAIRRGDITENDADAVVRRVSDPVERTIRGLGSSVGWMDTFKVPERELAENTGRASGAAIGGGLGGVVGSLVGPYAGVMVGYHLAGGMGGAIGLAAGAIGGFYLGTELGGRAGGAVGGLLD